MRKAAERLPQTIRLFSEVGGKEVRVIEPTEHYTTATFQQDRTIAISVGDLPRGTYYLRLLNRDGTSENVRLVLE